MVTACPSEHSLGGVVLGRLLALPGCYSGLSSQQKMKRSGGCAKRQLILQDSFRNHRVGDEQVGACDDCFGVILVWRTQIIILDESACCLNPLSWRRSTSTFEIYLEEQKCVGLFINPDLKGICEGSEQEQLLSQTGRKKTLLLFVMRMCTCTCVPEQQKANRKWKETLVCHRSRHERQTRRHTHSPPVSLWWMVTNRRKSNTLIRNGDAVRFLVALITARNL